MKLAEKTAIVTGAGRNIGEEIAVLFAQEGAKVAVVDMDESRAKAAARIAMDGEQTPFRRLHTVGCGRALCRVQAISL